MDTNSLISDNLGPNIFLIVEEFHRGYVLERSLTILGCFVETAYTPEQARFMLAQVPTWPDLVIWETDGLSLEDLEVFHKARDLHPELKVIVCSPEAAFDDTNGSVIYHGQLNMATLRTQLQHWLEAPSPILETEPITETNSIT
ncbi:MAG: hypothetical protein ACFCD0_09095 [Gemmataceae bacterium]